MTFNGFATKFSLIPYWVVLDAGAGWATWKLILKTNNSKL
jgi:hypothetical protein